MGSMLGPWGLEFGPDFRKGTCTFERGPCMFERGPCMLDKGPCMLDKGPCTLDKGPCMLDEGPCVLDKVPCMFEKDPVCSKGDPCLLEIGTPKWVPNLGSQLGKPKMGSQILQCWRFWTPGKDAHRSHGQNPAARVENGAIWSKLRPKTMWEPMLGIPGATEGRNLNFP